MLLTQNNYDMIMLLQMLCMDESILIKSQFGKRNQNSTSDENIIFCLDFKTQPNFPLSQFADFYWKLIF